MYRVSTHGHSVPTDASLMLRVEGLFFERPHVSSELFFNFFYPVNAIIYTSFSFFKKELRLYK